MRIPFSPKGVPAIVSFPTSSPNSPRLRCLSQAMLLSNPPRKWGWGLEPRKGGPPCPPPPPTSSRMQSELQRRPMGVPVNPEVPHRVRR